MHSCLIRSSLSFPYLNVIPQCSHAPIGDRERLEHVRHLYRELPSGRHPARSSLQVCFSLARNSDLRRDEMTRRIAPTPAAFVSFPCGSSRRCASCSRRLLACVAFLDSRLNSLILVIVCQATRCISLDALSSSPNSSFTRPEPLCRTRNECPSPLESSYKPLDSIRHDSNRFDAEDEAKRDVKRRKRRDAEASAAKLRDARVISSCTTHDARAASFHPIPSISFHRASRFTLFSRPAVILLCRIVVFEYCEPEA